MARPTPKTIGGSASPIRSAGATVTFACAAMLVSYLPFSAVNGVLGTIGAATGANTSDLQWLTDAFAAAAAVTVLSSGVVSDLFGRRRVTLLGLALTASGGLVGFGAGWLPGGAAIHVLSAAQAMAGIGAGAVMSGSLALIAVGVPDAADRVRAISMWSAAIVLGLGGGPFLAGLVTEHLAWQWLFVPVVVVTAAVAAFGVARSAESAASAGRRLDGPGQFWAALGIAALIFGVIHGGGSGWKSPAMTNP